METRNMESVKSMLATFKEEIVKQLTEAFERQMTTFREDISKRIEDLESSLIFSGTEIEKLKTEVNELKKSAAVREAKLMKMETELKYLSSQSEAQERYSRNFNLRFYGMEESSEENCIKIIEDLCKRKLEVEAKVENAHRTGKRNGDKPRPIIAKFFCRPERFAVLMAAKKLKGSVIFINEDLTRMEQERKRELWPAFQTARRERRRAFFKRAELFIDGQRVAA